MRFRTTHVVALLTLAFLIGPFVVVLGASFDNGNAFQVRFPPHGFTLEKYAEIAPKYLEAFKISLILGLLVAAIATALGLMAALGIVRGYWRGSQFLQSLFRLPLQIPLVVTGAVFLQFYYQVVALTGVNPMNSLVGLTLAHVFVALPYVVASNVGVLLRVDRSLEEAAESLGASPWGAFWQVGFPALKPGLVAGAFYAFIVSFGDVPIAVFLVSSNTMTLPVQIFQDMVFDFQPSMLALSTLISVVSLALIVAVQKLVGLDMVLPSSQRPR
jgi:putative spermidine/putrescine transport system permease protein